MHISTIKRTMAIAVSAALVACALPPEHDAARSAGVSGTEQIRDPLTGKLYFVACNPCTKPTTRTAKTAAGRVAPARGGDVIQGGVATQAIPIASTPAAAAALNAVIDSADIRRSLASPAAEKAATKVQRTATPAPSTALPDKLTVQFSPYSIELDREAKRVLAPVLRASTKPNEIVIRGNTDSSGPSNVNLRLAHGRALAVKKAFVAAGVAPSKLAVSACTNCFIASNATPDGRHANRRADIELTFLDGKS